MQETDQIVFIREADDHIGNENWWRFQTIWIRDHDGNGKLAWLRRWGGPRVQQTAHSAAIADAAKDAW